MLAMLSASLFHVASHASAPHAVRRWGQSCLVAAFGLMMKSLDSWSSPGAPQAFGALLLGAAVILQVSALAQFTRHGDRIVRALVILNVVHILSTIQFAGLDPNPVIRAICSDLISAAALFSASFIV